MHGAGRQGCDNNKSSRQTGVHRKHYRTEFILSCNAFERCGMTTETLERNTLEYAGKPSSARGVGQLGMGSSLGPPSKEEEQQQLLLLRL
eukprot:1158968-Pelagomonas_calceolata.AAC.5